MKNTCFNLPPANIRAGSLELAGTEWVSHCIETPAFAETVAKLLGSTELFESKFKLSEIKAFNFVDDAPLEPTEDHGTEKAPQAPRISMPNRNLDSWFSPRASQMAFEIMSKNRLAPSSSSNATQPRPIHPVSPRVESNQPNTIEKPELATTKIEENQKEPGTFEAHEPNFLEVEEKQPEPSDTEEGYQDAVPPCAPEVATSSHPLWGSLASVEYLLCVAEPWCELIATNKKTWELRSYVTHFRH